MGHLPETPSQCDLYIPHGLLPATDEKPYLFLDWKIFELLPSWLVGGAMQVFDEKVC